MFRRDTGRFSRTLGVLYILAQYAGAICGGLFSYNLFIARRGELEPLTVWKTTPDIEDLIKDPTDTGTLLIFQAIIMEMIGTMLITFLYLT
mmetsp:Transcript_22755/g.28154  ORF Transcript_22755/g.28154 Transcript_22755/m.28154 type:complete len:91 (-) Transcript_22755:563-835(-)